MPHEGTPLELELPGEVVDALDERGVISRDEVALRQQLEGRGRAIICFA